MTKTASKIKKGAKIAMPAIEEPTMFRLGEAIR